MLAFLRVFLSKDVESFMESIKQENSPVEVTAVFINCEIDDTRKDPDNENSRFEREELFKHNALRNCEKKLALTIKLTSASANSADEYVPIDHVVEGRSQRRVRLLDPYVLRLRRDAPLEAYKLRFIETVSGILALSKDHDHYGEVSKRIHRDTKESTSVENRRSEYEADAVLELELGRALFVAGTAAHSGPEAARDAGVETKEYRTTKRAKRHEKNLIIEEVGYDSTLKNTISMKNYEDDNLNRKLDDEDNSPEFRYSKGTGNKKNNIEHEKTELRKGKNILNENKWSQSTPKFEENDNIDETEKEFALYEIENPMLWFTVHVNLFKKISTRKGNTLWNDITKGQSVSVSSITPDWSDPDITVHYKAVDFVPREEFLLPRARICLLATLIEDSMKAVPNTLSYTPGMRDLNVDKDANYILVPSEDVLNIDKSSKPKRTIANVSDGDTNERHRRVVVTVTRALWDVMEDKLTIVNKGSDKYLTLLHRGKRHAEIDMEVSADDNQLVEVSAPGRIGIIVADSSRGTRSTLTVQATNTGLFAGQFRAQIRECDSGLLRSERHQESAAPESAPVLLPPRQTHRLRLPLPVPLPADLHHCTVYLLNGNDDSVAVREAVIKKDDQCFCVWHCDCVCYGDDPKLLCQEMSAERQSAAGLPPRRGGRYARACRYSDVAAVDVAVVAIGVIGMLLIFGIVKGLLGMLCPRAGVWGLDWVLESPRRLNRYYESSLQGREVVYDDNYWPVHPDTYERTVRVVSLPIELILNIVFFVISPGLIVVDALKKLTKRIPRTDSCRNKPKLGKCSKSKNVRRDVQGRGARFRDRLARRSWMTPGAKELSECLWTDPSTPTGLNERRSMFPLLHDDGQRAQPDPALTSGSDSEQEDTAFVLMHMQKSTESLARNQMKADAAGPCIDSVRVQQEHQPASQTSPDIRQS